MQCWLNSCCSAFRSRLSDEPGGLLFTKTSKRRIFVNSRTSAPVSSSSRNCYEVLGIRPDCSQNDVKSRYYELSRKCHPDVDKSPGAAQRFADIKSAYDTLKSPTVRQIHDNDLARGYSTQPGTQTADPASRQAYWTWEMERSKQREKMKEYYESRMNEQDRPEWNKKGRRPNDDFFGASYGTNRRRSEGKWDGPWNEYGKRPSRPFETPPFWTPSKLKYQKADGKPVKTGDVLSVIAFFAVGYSLIFTLYMSWMFSTAFTGQIPKHDDHYSEKHWEQRFKNNMESRFPELGFDKK